MPSGRFAPSPTGPLHLGNLRTALVAWLWARHDDSAFLLRFEDLDTAAVREEYEHSQAADLRALGLDWDGPPLRQSERLDVHRAAVEQLIAAGLTYPCWCSRREIREAVQAPNAPLPPGGYPGRCRDLSPADRAAREATGRLPAIRLRAAGRTVRFVDEVCGPQEWSVDDFVISRGDRTPAYNLAVVVDDAAQGVELVVRADDLLSSTPRQLVVAELLGLPTARYAHVPLVRSEQGHRLAKRDGAVTLDDRRALGEDPDQVRSVLATSLGLAEPGEAVSPAQLLARFDPARLPRHPWVLDPGALAGGRLEPSRPDR
jgi:glutamyl-tRNA synthetase